MIWQIVKALAFAAVMIYAAVMDVRTRTIQTRIHVLLFFVGLIGVDASSVWGAFLTFLPGLKRHICSVNRHGHISCIHAGYP